MWKAVSWFTFLTNVNQSEPRNDFFNRVKTVSSTISAGLCLHTSEFAHCRQNFRRGCFQDDGYFLHLWLKNYFKFKLDKLRNFNRIAIQNQNVVCHTCINMGATCSKYILIISFYKIGVVVLKLSKPGLILDNCSSSQPQTLSNLSNFAEESVKWPVVPLHAYQFYHLHCHDDVNQKGFPVAAFATMILGFKKYSTRNSGLTYAACIARLGTDDWLCCTGPARLFSRRGGGSRI